MKSLAIWEWFAFPRVALTAIFAIAVREQTNRLI
jgi:hypothetical protein